MSSVSTHVLDTSRGAPATGMPVALEAQVLGEWILIGQAATDADGRVKGFVPVDVPVAPGVYRIRFDTGRYQEGFYPEVVVVFRIDNPAQHYHVPLLLSPFGYSTYRGS
jgi:5-hydroxyisourate hydrolase